jgi:DMSO/TMAO reductase YedYZ molybdopterin-dependent catalytic subunit
VIHGNLLVRTPKPLTAETPLAGQVGIITPTARFYVRNHFDVPRADGASWTLTVGGLVRRLCTFSLAELRRLPSRSVIVTLECAGNGRSLFESPVEGEPWHLGAVSTAEWTGVPLVEVLDSAGVEGAAREIVFRGLDHEPARGAARARSAPLRFERSLSLDEAQHADVLLAYAMNGEPLSPNHGFPLRLVVPGWYAMASVKWLAEIEAIDAPFTGYFQTDRYVIEPKGDGASREPLAQVRVRSLITEPEAGDVVRQGEIVVRGYAWSGRGAITRVEVDAGHGWQVARLLDDALPHAWRRWELTTRVTAGRLTLRSRATDSSSNTQPDRSPWNRLGYANNAIQGVAVVVVE